VRTLKMWNPHTCIQFGTVRTDWNIRIRNTDSCLFKRKFSSRRLIVKPGPLEQNAVSWFLIPYRKSGKPDSYLLHNSNRDFFQFLERFLSFLEISFVDFGQYCIPSVADPKQKFRIRFRIRIQPEVSSGSEAETFISVPDRIRIRPKVLDPSGSATRYSTVCFFFHQNVARAMIYSLSVLLIRICFDWVIR
jgi:hypothetical protein